MESTRTEVYEVIDGEREYQKHWDKEFPKYPDAQKSIAHWIIYMRKYLAKAEEHVCNMDRDSALHEIRKVTALGVACMEHKGARRRT